MFISKRMVLSILAAVAGIGFYTPAQSVSQDEVKGAIDAINTIPGGTSLNDWLAIVPAPVAAAVPAPADDDELPVGAADQPIAPTNQELFKRLINYLKNANAQKSNKALNAIKRANFKKEVNSLTNNDHKKELQAHYCLKKILYNKNLFAFAMLKNREESFAKELQDLIKRTITKKLIQFRADRLHLLQYFLDKLATPSTEQHAALQRLQETANFIDAVKVLDTSYDLDFIYTKVLTEELQKALKKATEKSAEWDDFLTKKKQEKKKAKKTAAEQLNAKAIEMAQDCLNAVTTAKNTNLITHVKNIQAHYQQYDALNEFWEKNKAKMSQETTKEVTSLSEKILAKINASIEEFGARPNLVDELAVLDATKADLRFIYNTLLTPELGHQLERHEHLSADWKALFANRDARAVQEKVAECHDAAQKKYAKKNTSTADNAKLARKIEDQLEAALAAKRELEKRTVPTSNAKYHQIKKDIDAQIRQIASWHYAIDMMRIGMDPAPQDLQHHYDLWLIAKRSQLGDQSFEPTFDVELDIVPVYNHLRSIQNPITNFLFLAHLAVKNETAENQFDREIIKTIFTEIIEKNHNLTQLAHDFGKEKVVKLLKLLDPTQIQGLLQTSGTTTTSSKDARKREKQTRYFIVSVIDPSNVPDNITLYISPKKAQKQKTKIAALAFAKKEHEKYAKTLKTSAEQMQRQQACEQEKAAQAQRNAEQSLSRIKHQESQFVPTPAQAPAPVIKDYADRKGLTALEQIAQSATSASATAATSDPENAATSPTPADASWTFDRVATIATSNTTIGVVSVGAAATVAMCVLNMVIEAQGKLSVEQAIAWLFKDIRAEKLEALDKGVAQHVSKYRSFARAAAVIAIIYGIGAVAYRNS